MIIYNEDGVKIDERDANTELGYLTQESKQVKHEWIVDSEEEGEWETIAEYPETGGKDVEWKVTKPEEGHWKTTELDSDVEVPDFDGTIADDYPHDVATPDTFFYQVYHSYTEEELQERRRQEEENLYFSRQYSQVNSIMLMQARSAVATMSLETDTEVAQYNTLLPDWVEEGHEYKQRDSFQWNRRCWRVSQDLTSSKVYPPDSSEALYYEIVIARDGVIVYRQCTGQHDSVMKGERRHYPDADGPVYESLVDYNAYSPEAYAQNWKLVE